MPLLWGRQIADELGQLDGGRAVGGADVVAAGGAAGAEALFEGEAEHAAQAEAGVEVVAGAGADLGLLDEGAGEFCAALLRGCRGAAARVNDNAVKVEFFPDRGAVCSISFSGSRPSRCP